MSRYRSKLENARVLIIGGTSGIGFGIAEALIEHGASVIVSSSSENRVNDAVQSLKQQARSANIQVHGFRCNLSNEETLQAEVNDLFAKVASIGKLDHIVHTAGDGLALGDVNDFNVQQLKQAGMVRFFSPLVVAQHVRQHLKAGPASSYTLTTGGLSERPRIGWAVTMSYLTGLEGMSRALARDFAPLRVNLIGPGPVDTPIWHSHDETANVDHLKAKLASTMATGAFGKVEDVVEAFLYVMRDKNITGSFIKTNGGGLLM